MFAVSVPLNPNVIILQPINGTRDAFSSSLPARLTGLITPQEYAQSIERINRAYEPGAGVRLARLVMVLGFIIWGICIAWSFGSSNSNSAGYSGPDPALMFGGFGAMVFLFVGGAIWARHEGRQRIERLRAAVAAEHAHYNSQARAAQYGPLPVPISWNVASVVVGNVWGGYRRSRLAQMVEVHIEIGGAAAVMMPQQVQPVHYQGQPYQAPAYPPSAVAQREGQPHTDDPGSPLLAGHANSAAGVAPYGSAPGGLVVGNQCDRCGRQAASAQDRFCPACGGNIVRRS
jgi:hypothetical protein